MNELTPRRPIVRAGGRERTLKVLTLWWTFLLPLPAYPQDSSTDRADQDDPKRESKVGRRLIREVTEGGEADIMDEIMRMMSDAGRRLDIEFDPGADTRAVQGEIVNRLNDAILVAAKQRQRSQRNASSSHDRRARPDQAERKDRDIGRPQPSSDGASASDTGSKTQDSVSVDAKYGDLRETRRSWGTLPQRERDEVIQGSEEAHLERFRAWIESYYRALQESDE